MQNNATRDGRRAKVLIAEDDPAVRRSLQLLLQGNGFDVRSYGTGGAILADLSSRDADCFVSDYRMPDMDGLSLMRRLRQEGWAGPAILITAYNSDDLRKRACEAGYNVVLEKPLMDHVLTSVVTRLSNGTDLR